MSDATETVEVVEGEAVEVVETPAPIKPTRRRSRSGSRSGSRSRSGKGKPATTATVQAAAKPKPSAASVKAGRAALAGALARGVEQGCALAGMALGNPAVPTMGAEGPVLAPLWDLTEGEREDLRAVSGQAVDLLSTSAVDPDSWAGRLVAVMERYAPVAAVVAGFGKILGPRVYLTYAMRKAGAGTSEADAPAPAPANGQAPAADWNVSELLRA